MISKKTPNQVNDTVIEVFKAIYRVDETDNEILKIDPNNYDLDPNLFYELLAEIFGLSDLEDDDNGDFGGFGGTVAETISFISKNWDGKTLLSNVLSDFIKMEKGEED